MSTKTKGEKGVGTSYGNSGEGAVGGVSGRAGMTSQGAGGTGVWAGIDGLNNMQCMLWQGLRAC